MDNRLAIEAWRMDLSKMERSKWNHPTTVWRKWQADQKATQKTEEEKFNKPPSIKEKLKAAEKTIQKLRKDTVVLPWGPNDNPDEQARAIMEHLSPGQAENLGLALIRAVKTIRETKVDEEDIANVTENESC
jgi:hypothetical protein